MDLVIYIVATAIGLLLSAMGMVFALITGLQFAILIGAALAAAHVGSVWFVRKKAKQGKGRQAAIVLALPIFLVIAVAYVVGAGTYVVTVVGRFVLNAVGLQ